MPRFSRDRHAEPTVIVRSSRNGSTRGDEAFRGADTVLIGHRRQATPMQKPSRRHGRAERWLIGASILLGATSIGLVGLIALRLLAER